MYKLRIYLFLTSISLLLTLSRVASGKSANMSPLAVTSGQNHYPLTGEGILTDETTALKLPDILTRQNEFRKSTQEIINLGPVKTAVWVKFAVTNETSREWFLFIDAPFLKEIDLYKRESNGKFLHHSLGSDRPYRERYILTRQMILPLNLSKGDTGEFYLRIKSNSVLRAPLHLATLNYILETNQAGDIGNGVYIGLLGMLLMYNLFVYISIREKAYLFYVFYILSFSCNIGYIRGYLLQLAIPNLPFFNHTSFFGAFSLIFAALFSHSFLNIDKNCPRYKNLGYAIILFSVVGLGFAFFGFLLTNFIIVWLLCFPFLYFVIGSGTRALANGFLPARFYLVGFGFFFIGLFIFMLKDNALLPENSFTEVSIQLGSSLEALILSFALANKLNTFKKEKEQSQALMLKQANLFSSQLIDSQEVERKRVAAELHDSIGQSLGMIKNKVLLLKRDNIQTAIGTKQIHDLEEMVGDTIQEVRNISYNLRPLHLDLLGLTQSIHSLLEDVMESGTVNVHKDIDNIDNRLSKSNEINVFRIIQEGCNNIIKHSQALDLWIKIRASENDIAIMIEDNGTGILNTEPRSGGFGLIGIRERVNILNGKLHILSNTPHGTILSIQINRESCI